MSMYGEEFTEERSHAYPLTAYPLTSAEAYVEARRQLCALSPLWCDPTYSTNARLKQHICYEDCTIFTGNDPNRLAICGTYECPVTTPIPGEGMNTTLILGVVALIAVGAVALTIASKGTKKKVLVAKVRA